MFLGNTYQLTYRLARLSTGEGLVWRVREAIEQWQADKTAKTGGQFIITDPGENNKRLFILDEELAAALQCTKNGFANKFLWICARRQQFSTTPTTYAR
jgi:hypothetical protein